MRYGQKAHWRTNTQQVDFTQPPFEVIWLGCRRRGTFTHCGVDWMLTNQYDGTVKAVSDFETVIIPKGNTPQTIADFLTFHSELIAPYSEAYLYEDEPARWVTE